MSEFRDARDAADADASQSSVQVVQVVTGSSHTCALLNTGAVRCWGDGSRGQLGYGNANTIGDDEVPASAGDVQVGGSVVSLSAGTSHTCALLETGRVRCWGDGSDGRLGYANTETIGDNEAPASAGDVEVGAKVKQLAGGGAHTCALLETGRVRCWGKGSDGQLGYGNTASVGDDEVPDSIGDVDVGDTVASLAAGTYHTCATLEMGEVRCWGYGAGGRLGYGNSESIGDNEAPAQAGDIDVGGTVSTTSAGGHTCALSNSKRVRCWGFGTSGQLGYANTDAIGDDEAPASAGDIDVGAAILSVSSGAEHTCAVLESGRVRCWGRGEDGRLGYGNHNDVGAVESPATVGDVNVGGAVEAVSCGAFHTCAVLDTGSVRCWGAGGSGQLGYGSPSSVGQEDHPASAGDVVVVW